MALGVLRREFDPEGAPTGYRDSPVGWVLEPPRMRRMKLSSHSFAKRFEAAQRFHAIAAIGLLGLFGVVQILLGTYYARVVFGQTDSAQVVARRRYQHEDSKGHTYWRCEVTVELPWAPGGRLTDEVPGELCQRIAVGDSLPVLHVGHRLVQLGERPTLGMYVVMMVVGLIVVAAVGYWVQYGWSRPWWRAVRIDQ